ncbi:hypothetical protein MMC13_005990 [Lambiella insularis]|nr:hypothetical protein [Lambiella insularis]
MSDILLAELLVSVELRHNSGPQATNASVSPRDISPPPPGRATTIALVVIAPVVVLLSILGVWLAIRGIRHRSARSAAPKTSHQEWIRSSRENLENSEARNSYRGVDQGPPWPSRVYTNNPRFFVGASKSRYELAPRRIARTTRIVWEESYRHEPRLAGGADMPWGIETVVCGRQE